MTNEIGRDDFVHGIDSPGAVRGVHQATHAGKGGTVTAYVRLEGTAMNRLREVLFTGDFFITPPRSVFDLEASLRGVKVSDIPGAVEQFFETSCIDALSLAPTDFTAALTKATSR